MHGWRILKLVCSNAYTHIRIGNVPLFGSSTTTLELHSPLEVQLIFQWQHGNLILETLGQRRTEAFAMFGWSIEYFSFSITHWIRRLTDGT